MWNILFLIALIAAVSISASHLSQDMFALFTVALGVYLGSTASLLFMVLKKFHLDYVIYVRTMQGVIEIAVYIILTTQVRWGWALILTLVLIGTIAHLKLALNGSKEEKQNYTDAVEVLSDNTIQTLTNLKYWINTKILRRKVEKTESAKNPLDAMMDRIK